MSEQDSPVVVIEQIPVAGAHGITAQKIAEERIPTPQHLCLYPELGRGGMGRVHPATDRNLLRHVALKRLDPKWAKEPMYRDGFVAEAQMTGQLEHPNIVPVHELALDAYGVPYFTMKLVIGEGFHEWLAEREVGSTERLRDGLEIILKICDALAYAHHRGVVHRDLKPENVMVGAFGQVYLMDWGLARLTKSRPASGERSQMAAVGPVGTPAYMAPEQARGNPAEMDERADVFGLGAMLYELATGLGPYGDHRDLLARAKRGAVVPLAYANVPVAPPPALAAIIDRAVAPLPADRHQSVLELQEDLRRFLAGGLHLPSRRIAADTVIFREGDPGDAAYMIVAGHCRAYREIDGRTETLALMGPGDVFGEMALLLDEPRAACVSTLDNVQLLVLDRETMSAGLGLDGWTGALVTALARRFSELERSVRSSGMRR